MGYLSETESGVIKSHLEVTVASFAVVVQEASFCLMQVAVTPSATRVPLYRFAIFAHGILTLLLVHAGIQGTTEVVGLKALSKALGFDTAPTSTEGCGEHTMFQKLVLQALTGAVGWEADAAPSKACGAQLLELSIC